MRDGRAPGRQQTYGRTRTTWHPLGATSYENDRNTDLAPRQEVAFDCPKGHRFSVPFAAEAEIPVNWECRVCGATAVTADR